WEFSCPGTTSGQHSNDPTRGDPSILALSYAIALSFEGLGDAIAYICSFARLFPHSYFRKHRLDASSRKHLPGVALANDRPIPRRPHARRRRRSHPAQCVLYG